MDSGRLYDIVYALAARDGREATLFGSSAPFAREAFLRGQVEGAPLTELWFELPLLGEAWFDLHMPVSRADVSTHARYAGLSGVYSDTLAWFAQSQDTRQLILSFDTSVADAEAPAVQLLLSRPNLSATQGFLSAAGRAVLARAYEAFIRSMPQEWYACYTGLFPARESVDEAPWLRVECIVGSESQKAYAQDAGALRSHLEQVGLSGAGDEIIDATQELARSPFPLELQFNVDANGHALPALSASVRCQLRDWAIPGGSGSIKSVFQWVQGRGLADDRWLQLAGTVFSKRVKHAGVDLRAYCHPAFVKLRWRHGLPMDAKTYLIATIDYSARLSSVSPVRL